MRKYFEPEYGDIAPEVIIPPSLRPGVVINNALRKRINFENVAESVKDFRKLAIYKRLVTVDTFDGFCERDGYRVPLRVYKPSDKGPFPVMVFYHGGSFMFNNIDVYEYINRYFAAFGKVLVIAVDYRLAPEHKFPVGLEDSYAAFLWAHSEAGAYGGDCHNINLCGDSSGGNFVASISIMNRDRLGPSIKRQIMIYPSLLFGGEETYSESRYGKGLFLEKDDAKTIVGLYFKNFNDEIDNPYASPLLCKNKGGLPPAVFVSAECDILLDQALYYAAELEDSGVNVEYRLFRGMLHGFINKPYGKTFEALDFICDCIGKEL